PGRPPRRDRDALALDGRVALDGAVNRLAVDELPIRLTRTADDHARVERPHRTTLAAVQVARLAVAAERLDVLVDEIGARRRRAPRVVDAAPQEDAEGDAGEGGAARLVAA